ncbi:MAG: D-alanine--D-alanine ligase [Nitrospirota bacterium]
MLDILANKKIGVIMGGLSAEKEVSMTSGGGVENALRDAGYNAFPIYFNGPGVVDEIKRLSPDVVFLALHGRWGEDGTIQGLLEVMGVPYTGTGVTGSAIAMDKSVTKEILKYRGIPTADFATLRKGASNPGKDVSRRIGYPMVVKPSTLGSTIGMSFVHEAKDLPQAVELAFSHDNCVLLEKFIEGREVTAGILDGISLPLVEIVTPMGVYDYEAKYESHETKYVCPAELDKGAADEIMGLAKEVFEALHGYGVGRVDFRLDGAGRPYVLEMNTLPGMTGTSLLPKAALAAGIDFTSLIETILVGALKRHAV